MMRTRGSTLVEAAVVLLLFLVLLVAVMDVSQVLFFHHYLNDRVRAGARYAAVHTYDPDSIRYMVACNDSTARDCPGMFGLSPAMVQVNRYGAGTASDRIEVTVSTFTMHFVSPWLLRDFTPRPFRAVAPVESLGSAL
jgi:Flp pilus assembly protein TadG